jgi:hypothetical protein
MLATIADGYVLRRLSRARGKGRKVYYRRSDLDRDDYFPAVRRKPARTRYPPTLPDGKFKIILIIMNYHATV